PTRRSSDLARAHFRTAALLLRPGAGMGSRDALRPRPCRRRMVRERSWPSSAEQRLGEGRATIDGAPRGALRRGEPSVVLGEVRRRGPARRTVAMVVAGRRVLGEGSLPGRKALGSG